MVMMVKKKKKNLSSASAIFPLQSRSQSWAKNIFLALWMDISSKDPLKFEMCNGSNISFPIQNYFGKQEIKLNLGITVF